METVGLGVGAKGSGGEDGGKQWLVVRATVQIVNRRAIAAGVNGRMTVKPVKALLQLRRKGAETFLSVGTLKDTLCPKLEVNAITNIRTSFVEEGMATIETEDIQILAKNAKPEDLKALISMIQGAMNNKIDAGTGSGNVLVGKALGETQGSKPKPKQALKSVLNHGRIGVQNPSQADVGSLSPLRMKNVNGLPPVPVLKRKEGMPQTTLAFPKVSVDEKWRNIRREGEDKRQRSRSPPGLRKGVKAKLAKILKDSDSSDVQISTKNEYLQTIPQTTKSLAVIGISLKKIDQRIIALEHVTKLDLQNNNLMNVDILRKMTRSLKTVNLRMNQISKLDSRLRFAWKNVSFLDLSHNNLEMLPESFSCLSNLVHLDVSHNSLKTVFYTWMYLKKLTTLKLNDNCLQFLPGNLSLGPVLSILDISNNKQLYNREHMECSGSLKIKILPSLMELAATSICNDTTNSLISRYNRASASSASQPLPLFPDGELEGYLPLELLELLWRTRFCGKCRRFISPFQCKYSEGIFRGSDIAITFTGDSLCFRKKVAQCNYACR